MSSGSLTTNDGLILCAIVQYNNIISFTEKMDWNEVLPLYLRPIVFWKIVYDCGPFLVFWVFFNMLLDGKRLRLWCAEFPPKGEIAGSLGIDDFGID